MYLQFTFGYLQLCSYYISKLAYWICQLASQISKYCIANYMSVKYKTIANNTRFDDFLPLDDEMEPRVWGFQQWRNWKKWTFHYFHRKCMRFYKFVYFVKNSHLPFTKINKFGINQLLLNCSIKFHQTKLVVTMVTD